MTYKQLNQLIAGMTEEQSNQDVTVFVNGVGEFYAAQDELKESSDECDVLDPNHFYLEID